MIYFLKFSHPGPIKIGTTEIMCERVGQHCTSFGRPACVLGVMPGGRDEEQAIHALFNETRVGRRPYEWFVETPDLLDFIRESTTPWDGSSDRPPAPDTRVVVLNLMGSQTEKDYLDAVSGKTGVPKTVIARRGIAMWAIKRGLPKPPADWVENGD